MWNLSPLFEELKICKEYKLDGKPIDFFPSNTKKLERVECVYETLPGWAEDLSDVKEFKDLPANAQNYVDRVGQLTGAAVTIIGVGPKRNQTIFR